MTHDEIVEKLLKCFHLYNNYPVGSRGPAGLLMDVIRELRPEVAEAITEDGADEAFARFYSDDL